MQESQWLRLARLDVQAQQRKALYAEEEGVQNSERMTAEIRHADEKKDEAVSRASETLQIACEWRSFSERQQSRMQLAEQQFHARLELVENEAQAQAAQLQRAAQLQAAQLQAAQLQLQQQQAAQQQRPPPPPPPKARPQGRPPHPPLHPPSFAPAPTRPPPPQQCQRPRLPATWSQVFDGGDGHLYRKRWSYRPDGSLRSKRVRYDPDDQDRA
jgi:hypothetical protein